MRNKGLTLIELIVVGLVATILVILVTRTHLISVRNQGAFLSRSDAESAVMELVEDILREGRLSTICRLGLTANPTLECQADFTNFPVGTLSTASFEHVNNEIIFKREGNEFRRYRNISEFLICDEVALCDTSSACQTSLLPQEIFTARRNSINCVTPPMRFVRFRVGSTVSSQSEALRIQSSFFTRHPLPAPYQNLAYDRGRFE